MSVEARVRAGAKDPKRRVQNRQNVGMNVDTLLCFDTETDVGFRQHVRVGGFQIKHRPTGAVLSHGFFTGAVEPDELATVREYVATFASRLEALEASELTERLSKPAGQRVMTSAEDVRKAYQPTLDYVAKGGAVHLMSRAEFAVMLLEHSKSGTAICGHNLPFDIGAISTDAWSHTNDPTYGTGFHLAICGCEDRKVTRYRDGDRVTCERHECVITTHMGGKKMRVQLSGGASCGPWIDTVVLGAALAGPGRLSLEALGATFGCRILKRDSPIEHGASVTSGYLDYLATDVLASMELAERQIANYERYGLDTPVAMIFSGASLGKAMMKQCGIKPWMTRRPFHNSGTGERITDARAILNNTRKAYCGARSEVRQRLKPVQVAHVDFMSQYPTVNYLMELQQYMVAESYMVWNNDLTRSNVERILERADLDWCVTPKNWQWLSGFALIDPTGCMIPMRWDEGAGIKPFGLVGVKSYPGCRWVTLCDLIASKLLTGNTPRIIEGLFFMPHGTIPTTDFNLFGEEHIELSQNDLFGLLISVRAEVKKEIKALKKQGNNTQRIGVLEDQSLGYKIIANGSSYGILAETLMDSDGFEQQGAYYAPHVVAHITAGGRLMLAMAEAKAKEIFIRSFACDVRYAMCDTDSFTIIKPESVDTSNFDSAVKELTDWFSKLSPYETVRDILVRDEQQPLWFFGISCKRYAMYEKTDDGKAIKRFVKVSAHGTGAKFYDGDAATYGISEQELSDGLAPITVANPSAEDRRDAPVCRPWQELMWRRAIERAEGWREPAGVEAKLPGGFPPEPWNRQITRSQFRVATPGQLKLYRSIGARPYSFFTLVMSSDKRMSLCAPFRMNSADTIAAGIVNVRTGRTLSADEVKKYTVSLHEAFADYFANNENKSEGPKRVVRWRFKSQAFQEACYLERPTRDFASETTVNRKGKSVSQAELDLFEDSDAELEVA